MQPAIYRRGATLFVSNSVGQGLAFLTSIVVGRTLGVQGFGEYAAIMALVFVIGLTIEAGMEAVVTRDVARDPTQAPQLLLSSLIVKGTFAALVALFLAAPLVAAALAPSPGSVGAVQIAGVLIALNAANSSFSAVFRGWGRMNYVLAINVSGSALQLLGAFAVLSLTRSVAALIAWLAAVQLFELALGIALFRRGAPAPIEHTGRLLSLPTARALLKSGLPFALAGIMTALVTRVDLFLVEALRGAGQVGIYSVAQRLHELLALAPNSFFGALFPALATAHAAGGLGASSATYSVAARRMAAAGLVGALVGLVFADVLVSWTFGPAYADSVPVLRIMSVLLIPLLVNRTTTAHLYATHREGLANRLVAMNLVLRAALGYLLVSLWGVLGAALAVLLAECATLLVYWAIGAMSMPEMSNDIEGRLPVT
jgi:O-antigen/teichoic acid export membrane protein